MQQQLKSVLHLGTRTQVVPARGQQGLQYGGEVSASGLAAQKGLMARWGSEQ